MHIHKINHLIKKLSLHSLYNIRNGYGFSGTICDSDLEISTEPMYFGLIPNEYGVKMFQQEFTEDLLMERFICEENGKYEQQEFNLP